MADRTVTVRLQAQVADYLAKLSAASRATTDLANKVDLAKGRAAEGYATIGKGMMLAGGLVGAGVAIAVHEMAGFESRLAQVQSLSRAGTAEMGKLRDAAMTTGTAFGFSASEAADAEIELTKAGISTADMLNGALKGALTLAAAGQIDVAQATEIASSAMTQFGLAGKDVPHIADLLAAGADRALGGVGDLGYGLDQAGLQAHAFGISIEETVGTLSAFASAGLIGERGGTTFKQMLVQLSSPSKQASDIMAKLGINVYDTSGKFVGMAGLAGQLQTKMAGLTQAEKNHNLAVIFGSRAVLGANVLMQEGAKGIEDWTNKVNVSGFAALQAAGKMNSLSGDVQKLKASLQNAFIGAGENANGPLRVMVQDITAVINAWNRLPGPIKEGIEILTVVGGSMAFVGGAALVLVPKIKAVDLALKEMSGGAITARGAMGKLAKGGLVITAIVGTAKAVEALGGAVEKHFYNADYSKSVDEFTSSLIDMANTGGKATREMLIQLPQIAKALGPIGDNNYIPNLDKALADLVTNGHLDIAQEDFKRINAYMLAAGFSTAEITKRFPELSSALAQSENSSKLAADGMDQFGNQTDRAGNAMVTATQKAKAYSDAMHALSDPLFAMNSALQTLREKQKAANDAIARYGKHSKEARQANLELASAALDVSAAATDLKAKVKDGSVSISQAVDMLHDWVAAGIITKGQADAIAKSFGGLIGKAKQYGDLHPHVTVTADTAAAKAHLAELKLELAGLHDKTIHVRTLQDGRNINGGSGGHILDPQSDGAGADGGWIPGRGGPRADDKLWRVSSGEFIVNAASAKANGALLEAINSGANVTAVPTQRSAGAATAAAGKSVSIGDTIVYYPTPEKASESVPRVQRDMLVRAGIGWS